MLDNVVENASTVEIALVTPRVMRFSMDHHFHSTRPISADPDHLQLLPGHEGRLSELQAMTSQRVFRNAFAQQRW
eukprot:688412-Rhodomonas_salina.1